MTLITRDGLNIVLTKANQIVYEKWLKIYDAARTQVRDSSKSVNCLEKKDEGRNFLFNDALNILFTVIWCQR